MLYIYPRLSKYDLILFRLGGAGMGNILFTYIDAYVISQKYDLILIWPTWTSIKIGPWIRRERDKRFYCGLYKPLKNQIHGVNKIKTLLRLKKRKFNDTIMSDLSSNSNEIIIYERCDYNIEKYIPYREDIKQHLLMIIDSTVKQQIKKIYSNDMSINIHVRLGDFAKDNERNQELHLVRSPIEWFVSCIEQISRVFNNRIEFRVFSDGSDEELAPLLSYSNVNRCYTGSSIGDLIALSNCKLIIATGPSSYSLWARFLGNTSCLCFEKEPLQKVNTNGGFEEGVGYNIGEEVINKIKKLYSFSEDR